MALRFPGLAAVALLAATVTPALAQTDRAHIGPRVSYHLDLEEVGVGGQLGVPIGRYLEFYPSFDYFLVDVGTRWNLNGDFKYRLPSSDVRWLFLGAGLNVGYFARGNESDTRGGLNLFAGVESLVGSVHPFAEFRFTANNGGSSQILAGLNFTLRSH